MDFVILLVLSGAAVSEECTHVCVEPSSMQCSMQCGPHGSDSGTSIYKYILVLIIHFQPLSVGSAY